MKYDVLAALRKGKVEKRRQVINGLTLEELKALYLELYDITLQKTDMIDSLQNTK